ncbi:DUF2971 domain-containing protein [Mesorhizobium sp. M0619]|uniref:DUF2971 domain-containing protein n=1 Tax=unclassified Mesorhizobium TaxID=325217 RepID=UPI0033389767
MDQEEGFFQPLFLGSSSKRYDEIATTHRFSLVHYTSATVLLEIIKNQAVWMRNARCMNDFQEVTYALDGIRAFFSDAKNAQGFKQACDSCHPGTHSDLDRLLNGHLPSVENGAYITCLSEHDNRKERSGRLSMWRGYGGKDVAVAIYLNNKAIVGEGPYGLSGYPVEYWNLNQIFNELRKRIAFIKRNKEKIQSKPKSEFISSLFAMFQYFATAVKHPSFSEEKEWRLVYLPNIFPTPGLQEKRIVRAINGMPQTIYCIPIDGKPINQGNAVTIDMLVSKVVVGPCFEASVALDAIRTALLDAGHQGLAQNVSFCGIPFREKV